MTRRSGSFRSGSGLTLHALDWRPEGREHASVVVAHGYAEHSARYDSLAQALVARGMAVHALDFPGHGRSAGPRGEVRSFASLVADLGAFVAAVRDESPGLPCALIGHSVGGEVAAALASERPGLVDALVLSAPYLRHGQPLSPGRVRSVRLLALLLPRLRLQRVEPQYLSRIPAEVEAYRNDPLVYHRKTSAHTAAQLFAGFETIHRAERITAPLLLVHGDEDRVADPRGSRELLERVSSQDVTFELVPGGYHELLNDLGRERIHRLIADWLEARLASAP